VGATLFLSQVLADIRDQADINGATARHSATLLARLANQSHRHLRRQLSIDGAQHYLTSTSGTLGTGTTSPYPFYVLDLTQVAPSIVQCFGVHVTVQTEVLPLSQVPFTSITDYGGTSSRGVPQAWAALNTAKLAILPAAGTAYPYVVWYLPVVADLVNDNDVLAVVEGGDEFIVWDCVARLIMRDQYPQAFAMAVQMRDEKYREVLSSAKKVTGAGGMFIGRDVLAERLGGLGSARRRALPPP
jgi:hypothetical protein